MDNLVADSPDLGKWNLSYGIINQKMGQYNEVWQMTTFHDVVEVIKSLSTDEKQEIQILLNQYIREERRDEIYDNFKLAQVEQQKGELKFSSNINELSESLRS